MRISVASALVVTALLAACGGAPSPEHAMQVTLPTPAELQRVADLRIVFAHQSVGNHILADAGSDDEAADIVGHTA